MHMDNYIYIYIRYQNIESETHFSTLLNANDYNKSLKQDPHLLSSPF